MLTSLSLRLRIFLIFAGLGLGAVAVAGLGLWFGYASLGQPEVPTTFLQIGLAVAAAMLGLVAAVWYLFDINVAKPIDLLSRSLRARAHAQVDTSLDMTIARYLGDLAPAAAAAALSLAETRNALTESVARETARLSAEKTRLEALLSDVPVGVLLCSGDHTLAFYNGQGVDLLGTGGAAGLDRNLFDYLHAGPVRHAYQRLLATGDSDAASDLLCTTTSGARVMAARMRLLEAEHGAGAPGYVLTLRDVTADLNAYAKREGLLADFFDLMRRHAANLSSLLAVQPEGAPIVAAVDQALRLEVQAFSSDVTDLTHRHDDSRSEGWPLALTRASDLLDGLTARMHSDGLTVTSQCDPLLLRCNGFEVIGLLAVLAKELSARCGHRDFAVSLTEDGTDAMIRLGWQGAALPLAELERWLDEAIDASTPDVSGRAVLQRHATDIWPESRDGLHALCLPIRAARRDRGRPKPVARAVVYDFDLLSKARNAPVADSRLQDLTYVVFDTETTGLFPDQGDEIVQIAAVRIVNGRRLRGEQFDMLVNPGRPIPASSTEVHGITEAMVANAPGIAEAGRRFHEFAQGAVLIAHNAPFDMQFLRRAEPLIGEWFDHPVLDTVLLSAVVYGPHETHSLDALAHRLGITIPEEARHTALGDSIATADAFLKMLPILQSQGLQTFGDVLTEVRRHGKLMRDMN